MTDGAFDIVIRNFREGDEVTLAALFGRYLALFAGPRAVTAESWRRTFDQQSWKAPSLDDPASCRIAERDGDVVGYAVTDHQVSGATESSVLQELCVAGLPDARAIAQALVADAERLAREHGRACLLLELSEEDGLATSTAQARGYSPHDGDGGVFMAVVTDLAGCLDELVPALVMRVAASSYCDWQGSIALQSGEQAATLVLASGRVTASPEGDSPDVIVRIHPDWLPLLLLGREAVGEAYSQDALAVTAPSILEALSLLTVLFPRIPMTLVQAQWW